MFWSYFINSGFVYLPFVAQIPSTDENIDVPSHYQAPLPTTLNEGIILNLTEEDHLKAGYNKTKKLWDSWEDEKLIELKEKFNMEWD